MVKLLKGFQVFEYSPTGGKHSVSKVYPTWLGCKRVRNRIAKENCKIGAFCYKVERIYETKED